MSVTFVRRSIRRFRWHHFRTRSSASRSTTFTCPRPRPAHRSWLTQRCSWPRTRNTCGPPSNKTSKSSWPARCKGETTTWAPAACGWTLPPAPYRNCTVISPYTNNIIPNTILFRIHAVPTRFCRWPLRSKRKVQYDAVTPLSIGYLQNQLCCWSRTT